MIATLIGCLFIIFGFWGILAWFPDFLTILRGFVPISLVLGGLVAIASGLGSLRKPRAHEKNKK